MPLEDKLNEQLLEIREHQKSKYYNNRKSIVLDLKEQHPHFLRNEPELKIQQHLEKNNIDQVFKDNDSIEISENSKWKKNTILVTGDSMISGIQQARLSKKER